MEEGHGIEGYESEHWEEEGYEVSGEQRSDCGLKNVLVVFADRVLVAILLCALRVTDGFIKGAVASQVG